MRTVLGLVYSKDRKIKTVVFHFQDTEGIWWKTNLIFVIRGNKRFNLLSLFMSESTVYKTRLDKKDINTEGLMWKRVIVLKKEKVLINPIIHYENEGIRKS